eukprot:TCALIF_05432-PA protein Name:"Similar to DNMBP Dynamin-binding protein (Homo sapiens)" AED:0.05 eAED:0.05 QI:0/0.53/0.43/1/0.8/0.87/16/1294/2068
MKPGDVARVIRDFLTTQEDELCLVAGDYVQIVSMLDRHWALGRHNLRQGRIPTSHITPEDIGQLPDHTRLFVASSTFEPEQEGDLALTPGTLVIGYETVDDHWLRGSSLGGNHGTFPPAYCWELDATNYVPAQAAQRHMVEKYAQVVHSLQAQLAEEIDLVAGEIVKIVEIIDRDWYRGEARGQTGIFPASFVKIVDAFPGDTPKAEANVKPYVEANQHKGNEYMNTRNTFEVMEKGLKSMGQQSMLKSVINGLDVKLSDSLASNPFTVPPIELKSEKIAQELLQDDYFKQNLPSSYGSVSLTPPLEQDYDVEQSVFGGDVARCSQGFMEMSNHLRGITGKYGSLNAPEERKLLSNPDYNKVSENLRKNTQSMQRISSPSVMDRSASMAHYNRFTDNMKVFETEPITQDGSQRQRPNLERYSRLSEQFNLLKRGHPTDPERFKSQSSSLMSAPDYNRMDQNLGVFKKPRAATPTKQKTDDLLADDSESFRYQNITCESVGYTMNEVNVKPYAITRFNFVAEFDSELGFAAGEMVYLHRYVDNEWLEGEIDNQVGMFPIHYVNIIVDCNQDDSRLGKGTEPPFGSDGNSTTTSSEVFKSTAVTVHENLDPDSYHRVLYNFHAQIDGDITVAEGEVVRIKEKQSSDWVEVENSAGEVGVMPGNHLDPASEFDGRAQFDIERLINYKNLKEHSTLDTLPHKTAVNPDLKFFDPLCSPDNEMMKIEQEMERKAKEPVIKKLEERKARSATNPFWSHRNNMVQIEPKQPKDIESLIHTNLTKLRSDSPNRGDTIDATFHSREKIQISQMVLDELRGKRRSEESSPQIDANLSPTDSETAMENQPPPAFTPPPKIPAKSIKKRPAPPKPNKPSTLAVKSNQPPPVPPPPRKDEPLYSRIHKLERGQSVLKREPPQRPPGPFLKHSVSLPASTDEETIPEETSDEIRGANLMTIEVDIHNGHAYDTPDDDGRSLASPYDETPTNENQRTILPAETQPSHGQGGCTGETFRSYINNSPKILGPPAFPPDKKSPMSPSHGPSFPPPKVASLPCRSDSVASSIKTRSVFYNSVASDRGDSPVALASLNHSYETLNMSDSGSNHEASSNSMMGPPPTRRLPHRPAPPVPVREQFERSKEILFNNPKRKLDLRIPGHKKNLRFRKIHSLKRQILIKEKLLEDPSIPKEQLLRELDMYQEIAVAKGQEYDHLNLKMDHCQESIETLSDEIQRLQACLADEELKLEEDAIEENRRKAEDESRRSQLAVQQREDFKRKKEEKIKKNKAQRVNVIRELVQTEREFCRDLKLTWQAFGLDTPEILEQRGIDVNVLFGNLREVTEVSEEFLKSLTDETEIHTNVGEQLIGKCFLQFADQMKKVYTDYCINNDKAEQALEKYEQVVEIQSVLQKGVEVLQAQVSCFNIGSILIKPVQRILKYPLILNELIKCTEDDHLDRSDLLKAVQLMGEVASFINESKRRKDIVAVSQFNVAENVADLYKERVSTREVERFRSAQRNIISTYWNQYNLLLETRVMKPLQSLLDSFQGPFKLIQKRQDKHLDYTASLQKYEKNKDPLRSKPMLDDKEKSRSTYDVLNSQLVEELPKLLHFGTKLFAKCLAEFVQLRKLFIGRVTRELLSLMDLPLLANTSGDILEVFLAKHALVCNQLGRFSFSSKAFKPEDKKKLAVGLNSSHGPALGQVNVTPQSAGIRTFLRGKYAAAKLFQAKEMYTPKNQLDIGVNAGDLVGVVQQKDPMGNRNRWFVDNGITQGFLPSCVLNSIGENDIEAQNEAESLTDRHPPSQTEPNHAYDDVADESEEPHHLDAPPAVKEDAPSSPPEEGFQPSRKAPPVPKQFNKSFENHGDNDKGQQLDNDDQNPEIVHSDKSDIRRCQDTSVSETTNYYHDKAKEDKTSIGPTSEKPSNNYGYDDLTASEVASQQSQDLSPIYEEIHGGSRSTVSTSSSSTSSGGAQGARGAQGKFHFSLYAFTATDSTMLSVKRGQVVRVIQVTLGEWWYVENREGLRGYVPHLYLKEYPCGVPQISTNAEIESQARGNDDAPKISVLTQSGPSTGADKEENQGNQPVNDK